MLSKVVIIQTRGEEGPKLCKLMQVLGWSSIQLNWCTEVQIRPKKYTCLGMVCLRKPNVSFTNIIPIGTFVFCAVFFFLLKRKIILILVFIDDSFRSRVGFSPYESSQNCSACYLCVYAHIPSYTLIIPMLSFTQ